MHKVGCKQLVKGTLEWAVAVTKITPIGRVKNPRGPISTWSDDPTPKTKTRNEEWTKGV